MQARKDKFIELLLTFVSEYQMSGLLLLSGVDMTHRSDYQMQYVLSLLVCSTTNLTAGKVPQSIKLYPQAIIYQHLKGLQESINCLYTSSRALHLSQEKHRVRKQSHSSQEEGSFAESCLPTYFHRRLQLLVSYNSSWKETTGEMQRLWPAL